MLSFVDSILLLAGLVARPVDLGVTRLGTQRLSGVSLPQGLAFLLLASTAGCSDALRG